tara:strand:- start:783 stop:1184 length:402 start_codon:yes stop_codon:yes gene_type:complete
MKRIRKTAFNKALIPIDDTREIPSDLQKIVNFSKIYSEYLVFFILIKQGSSKNKDNETKINYLISQMEQIKNSHIRYGLGVNAQKNALMICEMAKCINVDLIIMYQDGKMENKYKYYMDKIISSIDCPILILP